MATMTEQCLILIDEADSSRTCVTIAGCLCA